MTNSASVWAPGTPDEVNPSTAVKIQSFTATLGQTLFTLTAFSYQTAVSALLIFKNGEYLTSGVDYSETSSSSITLVNAANDGDSIVILGFVGITATIPSAVSNAEYYAGIAGGTANVLTLTISGYTAYTEGDSFTFISGSTANTGAVTVSVNGLTVTEVKDYAGNALVSGDLLANTVYELMYDGTYFRIKNVNTKIGSDTIVTETATQNISNKTLIAPSLTDARAMASADTNIPLVVRGYSATHSTGLFQVSKWSGDINCFYIDQYGHVLIKILDDTQVPVSILGHSSTQSADLLQIWRYPLDPHGVIFRIAADGATTFVNQSDNNTNIQIATGDAINFHQLTGNAGRIQHNDIDKDINIFTSHASQGANDINNARFTTGGNVFLVKSTFDSNVIINPSSDVIALLVQGHAITDSSNVLQITRVAGGKSILEITQGNPTTAVQSDDDAKVPFEIRGNSATQSADLLHVYQYTGVPVFSIRANGGFDFTDPTSAGFNTYININHGTNLYFYNQASIDAPSIGRYEAGTLNFKTSTVDGALDVTNIAITGSGTTLGAAVILSNTINLTGENAAGTGTINIAGIDGSDNLIIGDTTAPITINSTLLTVGSAIDLTAANDTDVALNVQGHSSTHSGHLLQVSQYAGSQIAFYVTSSLVSYAYGGFRAFAYADTVVPMYIAGYSVTQSGNLLQVAQIQGGTSCLQIDNIGRILIKALADTSVPLSINGNSATQSAAILDIYDYSGGSLIATFTRAGHTFNVLTAFAANAQIANATSILGRNAADSADLSIAAIDASNNITIGDSSTPLVLQGSSITSSRAAPTGYTRVSPNKCIISAVPDTLSSLTVGSTPVAFSPSILANAVGFRIEFFVSINSGSGSYINFYPNNSGTAGTALSHIYLDNTAGSAIASLSGSSIVLLPTRGATVYYAAPTFNSVTYYISEIYD